MYILNDYSCDFYGNSITSLHHFYLDYDYKYSPHFPIIKRRLNTESVRLKPVNFECSDDDYHRSYCYIINVSRSF